MLDKIKREILFPKRFTFGDCNSKTRVMYHIIDAKNKRVMKSQNEVIDKLNELDYGNEVKQATINELKSDVNFWKFEHQNRVNDLKQLKESNDELSRQLEYYMETYKVQEYGLDNGMSHVRIPHGVLSRRELLDDVNRSIHIIQKLEEENKELKKDYDELKAQLYCNSDEGVCSICDNHYIVKEKRYDDLKEYLEEQISELDDKISKQREKNHDIPINLFDDVFKIDLIKRSILLDIQKRL